MSLTRKATVEFIGVFLIGLAVGGLIVWNLPSQNISPFAIKTTDPDKMVVRINDKYTKEYGLSPEELSKIQPMVKEMALHMSQIRIQFGHDVIDTVDKYHQEIAEQLTPEHRAVYEKANEERKKQLISLLLPDQGPSDAGQTK